MNRKKTYHWILFDADETLFHFDAFTGLQILFSRYGVEFTKQHYEEYQKVNKPLWVEYQNGLITSTQLQHKRFENWASHLSMKPLELNRAFLSTMTEVCTPMDGALGLLDTLKGKFKIGIVTNGFAEWQEARLERMGLKDYFELVVASEEVGVAKPDTAIFDYALSKMGNPDRRRVLMVGDTPESDILGGMNSGLDTCWFNRHNKMIPPGIDANFQISSLIELESILL